MNQSQNQSVVDMLTQVLEEAKRGEISSAVLVTMNGVGGHVGYWGRITSQEDAEAAPIHLETMKHQISDMVEEAS